jgi:hypothetical protein
MVLEKKPLSFTDIEAQTALELPDRETPVAVVIGCIGVCTGSIRITDVNVDVAANVCVVVSALSDILALFTNTQLTCTAR